MSVQMTIAMRKTSGCDHKTKITIIIIMMMIMITIITIITIIIIINDIINTIIIILHLGKYIPRATHDQN